MGDKNLTQRHNSRVYDNFLMHWGYVKREKINGKWRYWYENPKTGKTVGDKPSNDERVANLLKNGKWIIGDDYYDSKFNKIETKKEQKSLSDKAKSIVNTAKDKLGVDEREAYKDAKAAYENATDKKNEADQEAEKARRRFLDDPKSDYKADDAILKVNMLRFWREKEEKRGEEYMNAKSEYMDTPLGTALKVTETIKDIPFEVEYALKKLSNKRKSK